MDDLAHHSMGNSPYQPSDMYIHTVNASKYTLLMIDMGDVAHYSMRDNPYQPSDMHIYMI